MHIYACFFLNFIITCIRDNNIMNPTNNSNHDNDDNDDDDNSTAKKRRRIGNHLFFETAVL
jgi:hypothetical protein